MQSSITRWTIIVLHKYSEKLVFQQYPISKSFCSLKSLIPCYAIKQVLHFIYHLSTYYLYTIFCVVLLKNSFAFEFLIHRPLHPHPLQKLFRNLIWPSFFPLGWKILLRNHITKLYIVTLLMIREKLRGLSLSISSSLFGSGVSFNNTVRVPLQYLPENEIFFYCFQTRIDI